MSKPHVRRTLIAGNWKMNGSLDMLRGWIRDVLAASPSTAELMLLPPYPYLAAASQAARGKPLGIGAQDVSARGDGAYTGEVSARMLVDVGAARVLVGHSERRAMHGEDDACVAAKFVAAGQAGLEPVLCLGETLDEREVGRTETVVARQLDAVIAAAGIEAFRAAVVAYEPVWAIGTGRTASAAQAQEVHAFLRSRLEHHDATIGGQVRILYGGSMKPANAAGLLACPDIDGGLIGGASLDAGDFLAIAAAVD